MKQSLFFKIRLAFLLSMGFVLVIFGLIYFIENHNDEMELHRRLAHAIRTIHHFDGDIISTNEQLSMVELSLISSSPPVCSITKRFTMGPTHVHSCQNNDITYYQLTLPEAPPFTLIDKRPVHHFIAPLLIFLGTILAVLWLLYRSISHSLFPLKALATRIRSMGDETREFEPLVTQNDEIGEVAKAYEESRKKLQTLFEARRLLLRNIAHELKTPIAKGRFLAELSDNISTKERLESLFIRLEGIVEELLQVERITAFETPREMRVYSLDDSIASAIDLLFLEQEYSFEPTHTLVTIDFKLFSLALKNLFDNGIKFSPDGQFFIIWDTPYLRIVNKGEPMLRDFTELKEAFAKGEESDRGLGLGLYIVEHILAFHKVKWHYNYKHGNHYFNLDCSSIIANPT